MDYNPEQHKLFAEFKFWWIMELQNSCQRQDGARQKANVSDAKENLCTGESLLHADVIAALQKELEKRQIRECKIHISAGSAKGDNYMGIIAGVVVKGMDKSDKEITWHWIAKTAPQTDIYRELLRVGIVYEREVYMYHLFQHFEKFQDDRNVVDAFNSYPKFIMSFLEPYKETFVMENMKSQGYTMGDRKKPLDINHVRLVMEQYGKFHAISFALRDQCPEEFKRISEETAENFFSEQDKMDEMILHQETFNARITSSLDGNKDAAAAESLKLFTSNAIPIILKNLRTTSKYSVVCHGDSWVNNMLFKYENFTKPGVPTKVCLLDWQLARYGSPAFDLSYFIYACTDKDFRDKYYDQIIQLYYYSLCKHLVALGTDPEKLFPFSALQEELKKHFIFGFHMASMVLQFMTSEADEIPDWGNSKDVTEMMESMNFSSVNDDKYKERVRGVILHMHERGYFECLRNGWK